MAAGRCSRFLVLLNPQSRWWRGEGEQIDEIIWASLMSVRCNTSIGGFLPPGWVPAMMSHRADQRIPQKPLIFPIIQHTGYPKMTCRSTSFGVSWKYSDQLCLPNYLLPSVWFRTVKTIIKVTPNFISNQNVIYLTRKLVLHNLIDDAKFNSPTQVSSRVMDYWQED